MSKPNRTRRNGRKADQYKTFKAPVIRRKNTETPTDDAALDQLIETRTAAFIKLFDRMERENMSESDARIIATFATKDGVMSYAKNQDINDLSDLKVEALTEFEFQSILKRANHAINTIVTTRVNFTAGPFYINRGMRQAAVARERKRRGIKVKKPTTAAGIAAAMKAKKAAKAAIGM